MATSMEFIRLCGKMANKSLNLEYDLCEWFFGKNMLEMLLEFGMIPTNVQEFRYKIRDPAMRLTQILFYINGQNSNYRLERHTPSEFNAFDPLIQSIARNALSKVNCGFNYHLLVPIARCIEEIINAAGGLPKYRNLIFKHKIEAQNTPALPFLN